MSSGGKAAVRPLERPRDTPGDEATAGTRGEAAPVEETNLLERRLRGAAAPARAPPGQPPPGGPRSRREDRKRPGSVPEDTLADEPSRLTGGLRCPPARPAGARVRACVRRVLQRTRRLTVHAAKSAVDRPWHRPCLDCTCTQRPVNRRHVREQALKAFHAKGRALTGRTRGRTIRPSGAARRPRRLGWPLAWHTVTSAHGPWLLRQRPARAIALPPRSVAALGLPRLFAG